MKRNIFITGASGMVGTRLLLTLDYGRYGRVVCLSRHRGAVINRLEREGLIRFVRGSVTEPHLYASELKGIDTVVHLAAATGKARTEVYRETNAVGTERLIAECARAGVSNILYMSTVAVKFPDLKRYPYAQTKLDGERAVKACALRYLIMRPAMVMGAGSGTWDALKKLALAPVTPVFGKGSVAVQPISAGDLAALIISAIDTDAFENTVVEAGGPDIVTIEVLIRSIARACRGREPRLVHVPMLPLLAALSLLEPALHTRLPFTTGQLSSFRFDGTVDTSTITAAGLPLPSTGIDDMISACAAEERLAAGDAALGRECVVFCRHLTGLTPGEYVTGKYVNGVHALGLTAPASRFDARLSAVAASNRVFARLVDTYSSVFFKDSLVRKRLVLLLAIIESTEPACSALLLERPSGRASAALSIAFAVALFAVSLAASVALFVPLKLSAGKNGARAGAD